MAQVTIKQLLEAGVHFGHQRQRWNPKMKKYIFGERNGIYILNLEVTLSCLKNVLQFVKQLSGEEKKVLFVGTKKQAQEPLRAASERAGMPYVDQRWLGGMLTNFETVRKSIKKLDSIDEMEKEGNFQFVTKKEANSLKKEREKLMKNLSGVRNMRKLPGALFVIDSENERIAIKEANKLDIPVIAVLDTNANPDGIDYPIPGNDDAIKAIKLLSDLIADEIIEGYAEHSKKAETENAEENSEEEALLEKTKSSESEPITENDTTESSKDNKETVETAKVVKKKVSQVGE